MILRIRLHVGRSGHPVGSGVYFYRLQTGKFGKTQKLILLR